MTQPPSGPPHPEPDPTRLPEAEAPAATSARPPYEPRFGPRPYETGQQPQYAQPAYDPYARPQPTQDAAFWQTTVQPPQPADGAQPAAPDPYGVPGYGRPGEQHPGQPYGQAPYARPATAASAEPPDVRPHYGGRVYDDPEPAHEPQQHAQPLYGDQGHDPYARPQAGYGQPDYGQQYGQPDHGQQYGQPDYGQQYGQPDYRQQYGQPQYDQQYGQPQYDQQYGQPQYDQQYGQPQYDQQYGQPQYDQQYAQPQYDQQYGQPEHSQQYAEPQYGQQYAQPDYGQQQAQPQYDQQYGQPQYEQQHDQQYGQQYDQHYSYGRQPADPYAAQGPSYDPGAGRQQVADPFPPGGRFAGYPPADPRRPQKTGTNGFAIAGFVFSLIGGLLFSVVFSVIGLRQTKRDGTKGRGLAIAGLVLSGLWVVGLGAVLGLGLLGSVDRGPDGQVTGAGDVALTDLRVGDCVEKWSESDSVTSVRLTPCANAHDAQVVSADALPAAKGAAYPGDAALDTTASDMCTKTVDGLDQAKLPADGLSVAYFRPLADSWKQGDRTVTCLVVADKPMTGTVLS